MLFTGSLFFLKMIIMIGIVKRAPSSTAKNMPGLPFITKKSLKFMWSAAASMMEVVSPTSVAAPWRFDETAMLMIIGTGLILSFLQIARPTGATMRTVATLSMKAEMMPEKSDIMIVTHMTFLETRRRASAILFGILDSMK